MKFCEHPAWQAGAAGFRNERGRNHPACISHHPTAEARDKAAMTSLRLRAVLDVQVKYTCARQAARASS